MRSRRPWTLCRAFWMLLAVVLLVPALALGQTETGRISGTAMDEQGAVLPGATVTVDQRRHGGLALGRDRLERPFRFHEPAARHV